MKRQQSEAKSIFLDAVEIDAPAQRQAYIDAACAGDETLRREVNDLLRHCEQKGSFLESPVPALAGITDDLLSEGPGTVIGPYKLLEQIGEGGFGVVYMAEQEQPVRRKVALKVLKPGMDTKQVVARFEAERQALALMDHPNIAKVLDAGTTEEKDEGRRMKDEEQASHRSDSSFILPPSSFRAGRPYFVMELVRGIPITGFCDQNHLPVRERLELFVAVCQAVQHAHQKGIIHRDLKPSNVLVTLHDGVPLVKVIDFGIAKALGQERLTDKTLFTGFAQMIGTPLYMSPEQAEMSGQEADTRTDIYALGVLLYELLTGTTPFDKERLKEASYDEIRRIIREEEPAKPSTRISTLGQAATTVSANRKSEPRRLSQLFRGELDWIVMKALEKDRNRRYETASSFAADVQHYLRDEPVQACPPSPWYRFRKFARRNKRVVVMASFLFAIVVVAVAVLGISYAQVQEALKEKTGALEGEREALQRERQTSYYQNIALAERQSSAGNVGRAEELLDACPAELRGWEWRFLKRQRYANPLPLEHSNTVFRVAFSRDGQQIASSGLDGTIRIWDARTGRVLHTLENEAAIAESLTYSLDGLHLAVAHYNGVIRVWKTTTWELLATFPGHEKLVWQVAFSPNGRTLASASRDRSVKLWDLGAMHKRDADCLVRTFSEHPAEVRGVAFSSDGGRLLVACLDGTVKTWDVATGQGTVAFRCQFEYAFRAHFSPDARRLAWACFEGVVKVWDTATGNQELSLQSTAHLSRSVAFSPDGRRIALAGFDGSVQLRDGSTGRETLTINAHPSLVADVAFSPDGQRLASASYDHTVRLWDATPLAGDRQDRYCVTLTAHERRVNSVAFSPDGRWLASASWDRTVRLWELLGKNEPTLRCTLRGHDGNVSSVAFSSDNRTLASAGWDDTVKLWDLEAPEGNSLPVRVTIPLTRRVSSIGFSRDGQLLAVGQVNGIAIYDAATGKEVAPFKPRPAGVPDLVFGPDGRLFSSGASDPTIKVWDVDKPEPIDEIRHYCNPNAAVAVSPDGRLIASAGRDETGHTVKIWDAQKPHALRHTLKGHVHYVWKVAFSPDGRYLASGSWDSTVKLWDVRTGEEVRTLRGHAGFIYSLAFSPDGQRLASASGYADHGEVKVWDAALWQNPGERGALAP